MGPHEGCIWVTRRADAKLETGPNSDTFCLCSFSGLPVSIPSCLIGHHVVPRPYWPMFMSNQIFLFSLSGNGGGQVLWLLFAVHIVHVLECTDKILLHNPSKIPLRKKRKLSVTLYEQKRCACLEYKTNTENICIYDTLTTGIYCVQPFTLYFDTRWCRDNWWLRPAAGKNVMHSEMRQTHVWLDLIIFHLLKNRKTWCTFTRSQWI